MLLSTQSLEFCAKVWCSREVKDSNTFCFLTNKGGALLHKKGVKSPLIPFFGGSRGYNAIVFVLVGVVVFVKIFVSVFRSKQRHVLFPRHLFGGAVLAVRLVLWVLRGCWLVSLFRLWVVLELFVCSWVRVLLLEVPVAHWVGVVGVCSLGRCFPLPSAAGHCLRF